MEMQYRIEEKGANAPFLLWKIKALPLRAEAILCIFIVLAKLKNLRCD